jgi:hypothetical protein
MDILKAADDLLYQAKGNGRDQVVGQEAMKSNSAVSPGRTDGEEAEFRY